MTQNAAIMAAQSTEPENDSVSETLLAGKPPAVRPPRVIDFEELEKKAVDVLVDSLKYIATTCGIVIAMYSQTLREYLKTPSLANKWSAQLLLFSPLLLWFASIIATVLGIFPREYQAQSDVEKEAAVIAVRNLKRRWLKVALGPFLAGFTIFVYIITAQIFSLYPFR